MGRMLIDYLSSDIRVASYEQLSATSRVQHKLLGLVERKISHSTTVHIVIECQIHSTCFD